MELVWDTPVLDGRPPRATDGGDPPIAIHAVDARTRRYEDRSEAPWLSLKWLPRGKAIFRRFISTFDARRGVLYLEPTDAITDPVPAPS